MKLTMSRISSIKLAIIAVIGAVAFLIAMPATTQAQSEPDCNTSGTSISECMNLWMDHWFNDPAFTPRSNRSMSVTQSWSGLPRGGTEIAHNDSGGWSITMQRATLGFRMHPARSRINEWTDTGNIPSGRGSYTHSEENAGATGRAHMRANVRINIQFGAFGFETTHRHYFPIVDYTNPLGCRTGTAGNYWDVAYMKSAETGGFGRKYVLADDVNADYCEVADWATEGVVYQTKVCNGNGCTFPDLIGSRLSRRDISMSNLNRGVAELAEGNNDPTTYYSVMYRDGNQTGQMTFDKEVWDSGMSDVFEDDDDYVLFNACQGFSCHANTVYRANTVGNQVTR